MSDWLIIDSDASIGAARAAGFIEASDSIVGTLRFTDPGNAKGSTLFGTGLRTLNTTVHLILMNVGDATLSASPAFFQADQHGTPFLRLAAVRIAPRQAVIVDTRELSRLSETFGVDRGSVG